MIAAVRRLYRNTASRRIASVGGIGGLLARDWMIRAYCETAYVKPFYAQLDAMIAARVPFGNVLAYWNAEARRHARGELSFGDWPAARIRVLGGCPVGACGRPLHRDLAMCKAHARSVDRWVRGEPYLSHTSKA